MVDYFEEQSPNYSGFVVIGAGLPRTGTMSLRAGLGQLLDGSCYHMVHLFQGGTEERAFWRRALDKRGDISKRDWINFLQGRGFRAGVDYPIAMFYKELMEAFPEAKVVLTVRDPGRWHDSVYNSIYQMKTAANSFAAQIYMRMKGMYENVNVVLDVSDYPAQGFDEGLFTVIEKGKEDSIEYFNKWVEEVKRHVPKERLLVFEVKEGWQPLCKFLDLPVPDTPFPNVNDTQAMRGNIRYNLLMAQIVVFGIPLILSLAFIYYFFLYI